MTLLLLIGIAAMVAGTPLNEQWSLFKRQHGKTYHSIEEERFRMSIFLETLKEIEEQNAKYESGLSAYYLEINRFADMLTEEVVLQRFNGTKDSRPKTGLKFLPQENFELPDSIDWRQKGAVTPVKDQGTCDSHWAFSTTGATEGQLFKKTGKLISLSEQQLIDCSAAYGNKGCEGGTPENSFEYLFNNLGLESESSYPYEGKLSECKYNKERAVEGAQVIAYLDINAFNKDLKAAVATAGPISVEISANNRHFLQYAGGIFDGDTCNPNVTDHNILLIGYGSADDGYWLLKNSWGTQWGEEGYMRLSSSKENMCGITTMACYPFLL